MIFISNSYDMDDFDFYDLLNHKNETIVHLHLLERNGYRIHNNYLCGISGKQIISLYQLENILLSSNCKLILLYGGYYRGEFNPTPIKNFHYLYCPTFLFHVTDYYLTKNNVGFIDADFKHLYYHFNNKPRLHRCMMMDELYGRNIIGINSWNTLTTDKDWLNYNSNKPYTFNHWKEELIKDVNINDLSVDENDSMNKQLTNMKCLFSIVGETDYLLFENEYYFTEKTIRNLLIKQPFISYGTKNQNTILKDFGFKLYDDIIDYSFDDKDDLKDRISGLVNNLERLKLEDYSMLYNKMKDKLDFNYNRSLEIINNLEYIPELLKQFINMDGIVGNAMKKWKTIV